MTDHVSDDAPPAPSDPSIDSDEILHAETTRELHEHVRELGSVSHRVETIAASIGNLEKALVEHADEAHRRDDVHDAAITAVAERLKAHEAKDELNHEATLSAVRHTADEVATLLQQVGAIGRFVETATGAHREKLDTLSEEQIAAARRADAGSIRVAAAEKKADEAVTRATRLEKILTSKYTVGVVSTGVGAVLHELWPRIVHLLGG